MSVMRITGMFSGMDIDQIVTDLMKIERTKVDRLYQQRQELQWQKSCTGKLSIKSEFSAILILMH